MFDTKVLISSDDDFFVDRCIQSLKEFNIELLSCTNSSAQIISSILTNEPHLVILCGASIECSPVNVISCINSSSLTKKPLFIVSTDTDYEMTNIQRKNSNILSCLSRPVSVATVINCISTYLHIVSNMTERFEPDNVLLESTVTEVMFKLGIPANIKGYHYLRDALMLSAMNMEYLHCITKLLYPTVANHFNSTPTRVERAIRHSIDVLWAQGNQDVMHVYFGQRPTSRQKPTNSEFIVVLADNIRMKLKHQL